MSASTGKLSRAEFRRQKDLEEDRKAGRAPAEVDEDGNIINPHVPSYMAQAPWYMDTGSKSLKHQKKPVDPNAVKAGLDDWYQRGSSSSSSTPASVPKKFRKGACENCGSMSHKTRDCLERPRKKGAKQLGKTLAADERFEEVQGLDYAAKRDRWNGYDPAEHRKVVEEFEAIEQERRRLKEEQIDNQTSSDLKHAKKLAQKQSKSKDKDGDELDFSSEDSDDSDDEKYAEKADAVGQKVDTDKRMTIRNLRIREDRAKYLYNLDVNSAYYDPKTRTMREAPNPNVRPEDAEYAGDNFVRAQGGDANNFTKMQLFSWQAEARGNDLNLQANPTANERQFREFQEKKDMLRQQTKGSILEKYGGAEHFDTLPKELLTGQTEAYVEYNQAGKIVKGLEKAAPKSKYTEDVYDNNHTAVWGSWYDLQTGTWGYKCCHSTIPNSYCTGQAGIEASKASFTMPSTSTSISATASTTNGNGDGAESNKKQGREDDEDRSTRRRGSSSKRNHNKNNNNNNDDDDQESSRRKRRRRSASLGSISSHDSSSYTSPSSSQVSDSESDASRHKHRHHRRRSHRDHPDQHGQHRRRGRDSPEAASKSTGTSSNRVEGFTSNKGKGTGDVTSRLDKAKLKEAILIERAKTDPVLAAKLAQDKARKEAALPEWYKEAKRVNTKMQNPVSGRKLDGGGLETTEVSEEQLEAYRLVNKHGSGGVSEDPMANYRDEEEEEEDDEE